MSNSISIPDSFISKVKKDISVSDVVGKRVKLSRKGREYKGLSPFTKEKTPSFTVNDDKRFFHCFSTGTHGDIIDFVMHYDNVNFVDAMSIICDENSIDMQFDKKEDMQHWQKCKLMKSCLNAANDIYKSNLKSVDGRSARDYLKSRGIGASEVKNFDIGYAKDSFESIITELTKLGFSKSIINSCGLSIYSQESNRDWDKFRNRIMFPIKDSYGATIAFGGRTLSDNKEAKYLNSPETDVFKKRQTVYNIKNARTECFKSKSEIIVVEGYMDVVKLWSKGFKTAVAAMGTALTVEQIKFIWKSSNSPIICFDGDRAGLNAGAKTCKTALPEITPKNTLRFISLPDKLDPDDYISQNGEVAFSELIKNPKNMVDYIWDSELNYKPTDTPEGKSELRQRLVDLSQSINHYGLSIEYKDELLSRFKSDVKRHWEYKKYTPIKSGGTLNLSETNYIHEKNLVMIPFLVDGSAIRVMHYLKDLEFKNESAEKIRITIIKCLDNNDYSSMSECVRLNLDFNEIEYLKVHEDYFTNKIKIKSMSIDKVLDIWFHSHKMLKGDKK